MIPCHRLCAKRNLLSPLGAVNVFVVNMTSCFITNNVQLFIIYCVTLQNPKEADAMTKVQAELDETKIILVRPNGFIPKRVTSALSTKNGDAVLSETLRST